MRRISTGVQGRPILGNFFTETNTFSTREINQDIVLEPNGAGLISAESDLRIDGDHALIFRDSGNSNTITIESPAISSDYTLTLPTADGTNGTVLSTDGAGNLSFIDVAVEINNQSADTSTYYPTMSTSTSGGITDLSVSSAKLSFQPSSGTLTCVNFSGNGSGLTDVSANSVAVSEDSSTNGTFHPTFVSGTSGTRNLESDNSMTYNPSTGEFTATLVTASSDESLKTDIKTIDSALEKIISIRGVNFVRKQTSNKELGLIAQEVEKVLPEAVTTNQQGLKSIAYGNLVGVLVEAIKEQNQKIARLEDRL